MARGTQVPIRGASLDEDNWESSESCIPHAAADDSWMAYDKPPQNTCTAQRSEGVPNTAFNNPGWPSLQRKICLPDSTLNTKYHSCAAAFPLTEMCRGPDGGDSASSSPAQVAVERSADSWYAGTDTCCVPSPAAKRTRAACASQYSSRLRSSPMSQAPWAGPRAAWYNSTASSTASSPHCEPDGRLPSITSMMNGRRPSQSVSTAAVACARRKRSLAGDEGGDDAGVSWRATWCGVPATRSAVRVAGIGGLRWRVWRGLAAG